ncbi:MAG: hypothetical protein KDC74_13130 [Flavobacteriaceae bacterium]|jgi:predicted Fe-Mo cluster-binding NifX family protein|nr:hypothetical protein [Flavobacteriaceae bacterium]MCB0484727.1 hypothetical protein [Flavobacteriaceae bacterium]
MITKVAITSQNRKTVTEHAGRCRNFYIYTIEKEEVKGKELLELSAEETLHATFHGESKSDKNIIFDVDILLTKGIGNGAIQKLANHNVACYKITETDPDTAIDKLINGVLEAVAPVSHKSDCGCGGDHHHHHGHDHGHHH